MSRLLRIGPCYLFSSDNITDPLSTWVNGGKIRGNVIDRYLNSNVQMGKADQSGRTPRADSIYLSGSPQDGYELPLLNYQIDEILKVMPGSVKVTNAAKEAIGFSTPASTLTTKAFALVPVSAYNADTPGSWWSDDNVRYIEEGLLHITGEFSYKLPDGDDILESKGYTCMVKAFDDAETDETGGIGLYRYLTYINVAAGSGPQSVAITPDGLKAIVANVSSNNVTIITLSDNSTTTVTVGSGPRGVAITPDGLKAIVSNSSDDNVTIITLSDNSTTTVTVGDSPRGVAITPNGLEAIVANNSDGNVTIITLSDNSTTNVTVGTGPRSVAITPNGLKAIVANETDDNVTIITLSDNSTTNVTVGDSPRSVAITPDGLKAIVANNSDGNVTMLVGIFDA